MAEGGQVLPDLFIFLSFLIIYFFQLQLTSSIILYHSQVYSVVSTWLLLSIL